MIHKKFETIAGKLKEICFKYKFAVGILLFGILLMLLPPRHSSKSHPVATSDKKEILLETDLELLLQQVAGAGRVEVLLALERGVTNTYQTDQQILLQPEYEETETETVLISGSEGRDSPLLISSSYPKYRGAVVVCDGADNPTVRLNIVRAVSSATGLGTDKISVIKMTEKQEEPT